MLDGAGGNHRRMACLQTRVPGGGGIKSLGAIRRRPRGPLARIFAKFETGGIRQKSKDQQGKMGAVDGQ